MKFLSPAEKSVKNSNAVNISLIFGSYNGNTRRFNPNRSAKNFLTKLELEVRNEKVI